MRKFKVIDCGEGWSLGLSYKVCGIYSANYVNCTNDRTITCWESTDSLEKLNTLCSGEINNDFYVIFEEVLEEKRESVK